MTKKNSPRRCSGSLELRMADEPNDIADGKHRERHSEGTDDFPDEAVIEFAAQTVEDAAPEAIELLLLGLVDLVFGLFEVVPKVIFCHNFSSLNLRCGGWNLRFG